MSAEPDLFDYGIMTEASDIRAHVGVLARTIYVFQTEKARKLIEADPQKYEIRSAGQPGVKGTTAMGWLVPATDIPGIRGLRYDSYAWGGFSERDSTSEKGRKAVEVVTALLRIGRFPLWMDAAESKDTTLQITGTDIIIFHKARIQVKCDWRCGGGEGCTGNLFLQKSERNPLRRT